MNIFATSPDPDACAIDLDDSRLVKAVLETAQILSTVTGLGYRPTHQHHPVVAWARAEGPAAWTYHLLDALGKEYTRRFKKTHKSALYLPEFRQGLKTTEVPKELLFQNSARNTALGADFTYLPVHEAYRKYLDWKWNEDIFKNRTPRWTNRHPPIWSVTAKTIRQKPLSPT